MDSANESTSIVVYVDEDKILLALSHYVLSLLKALLLFLISIPYFFKKSALQNSTNLLSKSSPPK